MTQPSLPPSFRPLLLSAVLGCAALLGACGIAPDTDDSGQPGTALGSIVKRATDEAREKLATGNISLSRGLDGTRSARPEAEISPQGDLWIDGNQVAINEAQRKLLLDHRQHLLAIAEAGIAIGIQGADLGMTAATTALKGVLSGNTEDVERQIEAEAQKIEAEAMKICDLLPALMASQQALAASLPELAPYATMDQGDIDDCRSDASERKGAGIRA